MIELAAYRERMATGGGEVIAWGRSMRRRNLSPATIDKQTRIAQRLAVHLGAPIVTATTQDIEEWLDGLEIQPRTRYTYISHLATFYRWAIREGLCDHDPTARIDRPKVRQGLPRPIASDELRYALLQSPTPEMTAMLYLAAFAGLRCAEIAQLRSEDVGPDMMLVHGKGNKDRVVPVHPLVAAAIRGLGAAPYGPLFDRRPARVSALIRDHLVACGIRASAHQLRHWFATHTYEECADLRLVQELLGHSSPQTTAIYTRWSRSKANVVVATLSA